MSQQAVERALGRLVTDPGFRDRFFREPGRACLEVGLDLTAQEMAALRRVPARALAHLCAYVDARLCRLHVPEEPAENSELQG